MAQNCNVLLRLWLTPYNHQLHELFSLESGLSPKQVSVSFPNLSHHIISNSCNGLICLYTDFTCGRDVFLCNPTTKETRLLPSSSLAAEIKDGMILGVGMGHDYRSKDLIKVVKMWISYCNCLCKKYIVEEYDLRSDSWRTIESANPWSCEFDTSSFAMHYKGIYYWWGKAKDSTTTIVTLDVGGGFLSKLALPKEIDISSSSGRYLGVLNEQITLVCRNCCDQNANFDIWAMDGNIILNSCWTKLRTIENSSPCVPLVFWNGSELLLKMFGKMTSYNIDTEESYNINFENDGRGIVDICEATFCMKSQISVNPLPKFIY